MTQQLDHLKALINECKNSLNSIGQVEQKLIELLKKYNPDMKFVDLSKKSTGYKKN